MAGISRLGLLLAALEAILERRSALAGSWAQQYPCGPVAGALQGSPDAFVARHTPISGYPPPGPHPLRACATSPRGGLSGPRERPRDARPGPGGTRTKPPSSPRACERCVPLRSPSKSPLARRDPVCGPVMLAWRSAGPTRGLRLRPSRSLTSYVVCADGVFSELVARRADHVHASLQSFQSFCKTGPRKLCNLLAASLRPWVGTILAAVEGSDLDAFAGEGKDEALEGHVVASLLRRYGCSGSHR